VVANDGAITKQWNGFPTGNYCNHMVGKLLIITAKLQKLLIRNILKRQRIKIISCK